MADGRSHADERVYARSTRDNTYQANSKSRDESGEEGYVICDHCPTRRTTIVSRSDLHHGCNITEAMHQYQINCGDAGDL